MLPFAGTSIPLGYLLCNGAAVSRTTYAALFKVIGTKWGAGDGSKTFQLPDVTDRVLEGTTDGTKVGTYLEAGMPNITGTPNACLGNGEATGAFFTKAGYGLKGSGRDYGYWDMNFNASQSSSLYNKNTVQPPAFQVLKIIKI